MHERLTPTVAILRFLFGAVIGIVVLAFCASWNVFPPLWTVVAVVIGGGVLAVPFGEPLARCVLDSPIWLFGRRRL